MCLDFSFAFSTALVLSVGVYFEQMTVCSGADDSTGGFAQQDRQVCRVVIGKNFVAHRSLLLNKNKSKKQKKVNYKMWR